MVTPSLAMTRAVAYVEHKVVTFYVPDWHRYRGLAAADGPTTVRLRPKARLMRFNLDRMVESPLDVALDCDARWIPAYDSYRNGNWVASQSSQDMTLSCLPGREPSLVSPYSYRDCDQRVTAVEAMSFEGGDFFSSDAAHGWSAGGFSALMVFVARNSEVGGMSLIETTSASGDGLLGVDALDERLRVMVIGPRLSVNYNGEVLNKGIGAQAGRCCIVGIDFDTNKGQRIGVVYTDERSIKADSVKVSARYDLDSPSIVLGRTMTRSVDDQDAQFEMLDLSLWTKPIGLDSLLERAYALNSAYKVVS